MKKTKLNSKVQLLPVLTKSLLAATALSTAALAGPNGAQNQGADASFDAQLRTRIKHIIVIYQENWSFDSLYGQFPGANGLQNGFDTLPQLDKATGYISLIYQTPTTVISSQDPNFPKINGSLDLQSKPNQ